MFRIAGASLRRHGPQEATRVTRAQLPAQGHSRSLHNRPSGSPHHATELLQVAPLGPHPAVLFHLPSSPITRDHRPFLRGVYALSHRLGASLAAGFTIGTLWGQWDAWAHTRQEWDRLVTRIVNGKDGASAGDPSHLPQPVVGTPLITKTSDDADDDDQGHEDDDDVDDAADADADSDGDAIADPLLTEVTNDRGDSSRSINGRNGRVHDSGTRHAGRGCKGTRPRVTARGIHQLESLWDQEERARAAGLVAALSTIAGHGEEASIPIEEHLAQTAIAADIQPHGAGRGTCSNCEQAGDIPSSAQDAIASLVMQSLPAVVTTTGLAVLASGAQAQLSSLTRQLPEAMLAIASSAAQVTATSIGGSTVVEGGGTAASVTDVSAWKQFADLALTQLALTGLAAVSRSIQEVVLASSVSSYVHTLREQLAVRSIHRDTGSSEDDDQPDSANIFAHSLVRDTDRLHTALSSLCERGMWSVIELACLVGGACYTLPRYPLALFGSSVAMTLGYRLWRQAGQPSKGTRVSTDPGLASHSHTHALYTFVHERFSPQGRSVVIPYNLHDPILNEFRVLNDASRANSVAGIVRHSVTSAITTVVSAAGMALVMGLGVHLMSHSVITPRDLAVVGVTSALVSRRLKKIQGSIQDYHDVQDTISRLHALTAPTSCLHTNRGAMEPENNCRLSIQHPERLLPMCVSLQDVSISHGEPEAGKNAAVLSHVTINLYQGELVVMYGNSGCGKSTLISHLAGLLKEDAGQSTRPAACRVALVSQTPLLWRGTIADNVRLGSRRASDERVWQALESAACGPFVSQLPQGINTVVDGSMLSVGQQQRVALARALISGADIILLDEMTSSLDVTTAHQVLSHLRTLTSSLSCLVVLASHRAGDLDYADRVLFVGGGRVVEEKQ